MIYPSAIIVPAQINDDVIFIATEVKCLEHIETTTAPAIPPKGMTN